MHLNWTFSSFPFYRAFCINNITCMLFFCEGCNNQHVVETLLASFFVSAVLVAIFSLFFCLCRNESGRLERFPSNLYSNCFHLKSLPVKETEIQKSFISTQRSDDKRSVEMNSRSKDPHNKKKLQGGSCN